MNKELDMENSYIQEKMFCEFMDFSIYDKALKLGHIAFLKITFQLKLFFDFFLGYQLHQELLDPKIIPPKSERK